MIICLLQKINSFPSNNPHDGDGDCLEDLAPGGSGISSPTARKPRVTESGFVREKNARTKIRREGRLTIQND